MMRDWDCVTAQNFCTPWDQDLWISHVNEPHFGTCQCSSISAIFLYFFFFFLRTWGHLMILKQLSKLRPKEDWNRMFPLTVYYLFKSIVFPFILIYVYLSILKSNAYEYREYFWMTLREVSKHIFLKYCTIVKFLGKFIFLIDGINKITLAAACLNQVALL